MTNPTAIHFTFMALLAMVIVLAVLIFIFGKGE